MGEPQSLTLGFLLLFCQNTIDSSFTLGISSQSHLPHLSWVPFLFSVFHSSVS